MIIYNNDNTQLIEFFEGLNNGMAISQTFRGHSYEFYKENNNVLVRLEGETIGHLVQSPHRSTYESVQYENWETEQVRVIEWLDELDAYEFEYEV